MDQPLGRCVGNALEVGEAAEVLRGGGPDDVRELAVRVAGDLAEAAGVAGRATGAERWRREALRRRAGAGGGRALGRGPGRRSRRVDRPGGAARRPDARRRRPRRARAGCTAIGARGSARSRAGSARGACTRTSRSTPWWASSCSLRSATGWTTAEPWRVIHARDDLGRRAGPRHGAPPGVSEERSAAGAGPGGGGGGAGAA